MTREQQRARNAAMQVEGVKRNLTQEGQRNRYNALAHALPVWLRANGLLQAIVFLEAKAAGKPGAAQELLDGIALHLQAANLRRPAGLLSGALVDLPYAEYARWQEEAIRCAVWLKRFAAALLGEPATNDALETGETDGRGR